MSSWELVVTDSGKVYMSTSRPFPSEIDRLTLNVEQRMLKVDFNASKETNNAHHRVDEKIMPKLMQAKDAVIMYMEGFHPVEGYRVDVVKQ